MSATSARFGQPDSRSGIAISNAIVEMVVIFMGLIIIGFASSKPMSCEEHHPQRQEYTTTLVGRG